MEINRMVFIVSQCPSMFMNDHVVYVSAPKDFYNVHAGSHADAIVRPLKRMGLGTNEIFVFTHMSHARSMVARETLSWVREEISKFLEI